MGWTSCPPSDVSAETKSIEGAIASRYGSTGKIESLLGEIDDVAASADAALESGWHPFVLWSYDALVLFLLFARR
ncbi:hypothetical protein [Microseira wollei]|uniref:hypothetical protein n=1 Tax=Microseira wollei TaxID=467598 RepID=UPI001CFE3819|nr:hypothetical protein [Microseira wollei]